MDEWLSKLNANQRVLDLGSGSGSFDYSHYVCSIVAVDNDFNSLTRVLKTIPSVSTVKSESHHLPFKDRTFSLVVCNSSLEHFPQINDTLAEIGRILTVDGALVITVPNGYGFDDNLYRFLLEGGGHVNRFKFDQVVDLVRELVNIRLVQWHGLYSSYIYLKKPSPNVLPYLLPRFRRLARLPAWVFQATQFTIYVLIRLIAGLTDQEIALYGWALYFRRSNESLKRLSGWINVCMHCGAGHPAASLTNARRARTFYRCPSCKKLNPYFKPSATTA
jgi:SAM-dependent methyltransferase